MSHPVWVRGLKQLYHGIGGIIIESHPVWVRGLKPAIFARNLDNPCRTPCGCVD